jgi:hypothetical protein
VCRNLERVATRMRRNRHGRENHGRKRNASPK